MVCANITRPAIPCPVLFDFNITFSVNEITGIIIYVYTPQYCLGDVLWVYFTCSVGSSDYSGVPVTMTLPACESRICVNVSIKDDAVVENTESLSISLTRTTGLDRRISLSGTAEIQIRDNDREWCCAFFTLDNVFSPLGVVVAMNRTHIFVSEKAHSVSICATVENRGSVTFSFEIDLLFDSPYDSASEY